MPPVMELYQQLDEYSRRTRSSRMPVTRGSSPTWGNLMATLGGQRRRGSLPDQEHVLERAAGTRGRQERVVSVPDQRMVEQVREEERGRGGPPAPRNSVDLSVNGVDETIDVYDNSDDETDTINEVHTTEDNLERDQEIFDEIQGVPPVHASMRILDASESAIRSNLDMTIDLTGSPVRVSLPSSGTTSSQSPGRTGLTNPSSPSSSLKCPVCLEAFSSIRRRGNSYLTNLPVLVPIIPSPGSRLVSTLCGHVFCGQCLPACVRTSGQCPTCRRTIGYRDFHPLYLY